MADFTAEFVLARRFGKRNDGRTVWMLGRLAAHYLAAHDEARSSWEPDIELWGRVLVKDELVALVAQRIPLVIMIGRPYPLPPEETQRVLHVEHLHQRGHRIDQDVLEAVFELTLPPGALDCENFSLDELWDATMC